MRPKQQQVLLLRQWSDFLDAQIADLEAGVVRELGHSFIADEVNTAFLQTDEDLARPALKSAVEMFVTKGEWPPLDYRHYLHLQLRAFAARGALLPLIDGTPPADALESKCRILRTVIA